MIFVDSREGSKHFAPLLAAAGLPVELTTLTFGDLMWCGRGEGGQPLDIGIEFKMLPDLIGSIRSERLQGHQLPGMRAAKPGKLPRYAHAYLLVQGELKYDSSGALLRRVGQHTWKPYPGRMTIHELFKRANTLHLVGGLNPVFLPTQRDCVKWIDACYRSWTDEDLDKHKSHLAIYTPKPLRELTDFETFIMQLPGVGRRVVVAAEKAFKGSIRRAVNATEAEWAALESIDDHGKPRKFGAKARKVMEVLG